MVTNISDPLEIPYGALGGNWFLNENEGKLYFEDNPNNFDDEFFNLEESRHIVLLSFSLLASSTYIFNDIKDLEQDRLHSKKKFRPIAAGNISIHQAKIYGIVRERFER